MLAGRRAPSHTSSDVATEQDVGAVSIDGAAGACRFRRMRWLLLWLMRHVLSEPIAIAIGLALVAACERTTPAPGRKDTAVTVVPPPETTVVATPEVSTWDSTAGPALFVVGSTPAEALVIAPRYTDTTALDSARVDLTPLRGIRLDLFSGGKRVGIARVASTTGSVRTDSCRTWPTARLDVAANDSAATSEWNVAFEAGHAVQMALDSIAGLPSADSATFAADIARIASALPGDTSAAFRGLPFVVNKAWRARMPNGRLLVAAIVVRNVNQEANPRQERILLVAERDSAAPRGRYDTQYSERVTGLEETLETTDLVTMVLLGTDRRPTLVIARDTGSGSSYALIERIAGQWQRRWGSAYAGC